MRVISSSPEALVGTCLGSDGSALARASARRTLAEMTASEGRKQIGKRRVGKECC